MRHDSRLVRRTLLDDGVICGGRSGSEALDDSHTLVSIDTIV
jgi:hypothetical protein